MFKQTLVIPGEYQKCLHCKKDTYRQPSKLRFKPYCNRECYALGRRTGEENTCEFCKEIYYRKPGNVRRFGTRFCSIKCMRTVLKKEYCNEKVYNWKGQDVNYFSLHAWVFRHRGKANHCEHCGSTKKRKYDWANVDGKYLRSLDQFISLCKSCHKRHDNNIFHSKLNV